MILKILLGLILVAMVAYAVGPRPKFKPIDPFTPKLDIPLSKLDSFVSLEDRKDRDVKPDNESRIIWADPAHKIKTEYSLVYLHGFSASYAEGAPVNMDFAKRYGMNLYMPRLYRHGRKNIDAFKGFDPDDFFESAQQAMEIGKLLGEKVILMSCSTGGTLSVMLGKTNPEIHAFIMYSPNIDIVDPMSELVVGPWGKELTEVVLNGNYNYVEYTEDAKKYWYPVYHIDGIIGLKRLIKDNMTEENFKVIHQPVFIGYYYKDENHQDDVVSVPDMFRFYDDISTPEAQKVMKAFPDADTHVISSYIMNKNYKKVSEASFHFAEHVLNLKPITETISQ